MTSKKNATSAWQMTQGLINQKYELVESIVDAKKAIY